jgi:hypothetical protein
MIKRNLLLGVFLFFTDSAPAAAAQQEPTAVKPARQEAARVFLDCERCDEEFLKREVTFIDYVRNREDADVHVLVTTQQTGSGGTQFTLQFIGLGTFQGVDQSLTYSAPEMATDDEIRQGFARVFRLGLVRYAAETGAAGRLRITFDKPPDLAARPHIADRWNFWVFRATGGGEFTGEQSTSSKAISGTIQASRTTERWRHAFSADADYEESRFEIEEDEELNTVLSVRREIEVDGLVVKSLSSRWSAGLMASVESSTFRNYDLQLRVAPGLEFNFFPYSESARRLLTIQYTVGFDANDYREETVFGKTSEKLLDHELDIGLGLRQPWGTAVAELEFSQFLTSPSKYSIGAEGELGVRLFKGVSLTLVGEVLRPRDQIYLPLGDATPEEILLRQRQLATDYSYALEFGISYSFGSIFNNIVNPRFGGAGGF